MRRRRLADRLHQLPSIVHASAYDLADDRGADGEANSQTNNHADDGAHPLADSGSDLHVSSPDAATDGTPHGQADSGRPNATTYAGAHAATYAGAYAGAKTSAYAATYAGAHGDAGVSDRRASFRPDGSPKSRADGSPKSRADPIAFESFGDSHKAADDDQAHLETERDSDVCAILVDTDARALHRGAHNGNA